MTWSYRLGKAAGQFIFFCTIRLKVLRPEAANRDGAYVLACSHLSHLDPFLVSVIIPRPVDWMARIEFFRHPLLARILKAVGAFSVHRFGVPVSAIRVGLNRLEGGRIVGVCPEGGVVTGHASCLRGGPIKRGICLLSYRTGAPILPCVVLGSDKLNRVAPWLPFKRARLWIAFGQRLIWPVQSADRRAARQTMAEQLQSEFAKLFAETMQTFAINPDEVP